MPWQDTIEDNEVRGYIANKGWDRLGDAAAAQTILKSYLNLERSLPRDRTVVLPSDPNDTAAWDQVWQRLGAPKDKTGYVFEGIKTPTGNDPDPDLVTQVRDMAAKLRLSERQANVLFADILADTHQAELDAAAAFEAKKVEGAAKLAEEWKQDVEARSAVAGRAFEAMGLDKATTDALVGVLGVDNAMKMGFKLGEQMGEAVLLGGGNMADAGTQTPRTQAEAIVERNRLLNDTTFREKVANADVEAMKTLETLTREMVGTEQSFNSDARMTNFGQTERKKSEF